MSKNDNKIKHLEFLQLTITRMAANSFLLKAWGVTLVAALFALSAKDSVKTYIIVAYLPVASFWLLDGYYLLQERLFRKLYDAVRTLDEESITFSLDTTPVKKQTSSWIATIFSTTLLLFYGSIMTVLLVLTYFVIIRR